MFPAALLDPNVAFMLLVLGALGIYWEIHAPGMVVPGLLGLLLVSAGAYGLYGDSPLAIGVSVAFGMIVVFLGSLGMRARKAKLLTGLQTMVGEMGFSRTPLNPEGTVFVHGEYWQARSNHAIEAGQKVRVERIDNMTIWVTEA